MRCARKAACQRANCEQMAVAGWLLMAVDTGPWVGYGGSGMSEHKAIINWKRTSAEFLSGKYSREHTWSFDGGATIAASPSPSVVPSPYSNPACVDPEEAFVASISSCHMLTYLYLAGRQGFQVDSYQDEAVGVMTKNEKGVSWVSSVTLHPNISYSGDKLPTPVDEEHLHHAAHEQCFIANSIKTEVTVRS
jgi:organic hydroperoxide reductase OsmC/OhrA